MDNKVWINVEEFLGSRFEGEVLIVIDGYF